MIGNTENNQFWDYILLISQRGLLTLLQKEQTQGLLLFAYGNMIRYDPILVDMTSNFFALCTNMKVNLYQITHSGWSLV